MESVTLSQITEIKFRAISLLTYQKERLTINETNMLRDLCNLMDDILLERVHHPRYTSEEFVDATFIEHAMLYKASRNSEVKRLGVLLEKGLKW